MKLSSADFQGLVINSVSGSNLLDDHHLNDFLNKQSAGLGDRRSQYTLDLESKSDWRNDSRIIERQASENQYWKQLIEEQWAKEEQNYSGPFFQHSSPLASFGSPKAGRKKRTITHSNLFAYTSSHSSNGGQRAKL